MRLNTDDGRNLLQYIGRETECRPVVDLAFAIIQDYDELVNELLEKNREKAEKLQKQEMELAGYRMAEASKSPEIAEKKKTPARKKG